MRRLPCFVLLLLCALAAGCARTVYVTGEPVPMAELVVSNQTTWEVTITAHPEGADPAETLTLGRVPPESTESFPNLPANLTLTLQASPVEMARMLTRPARSYLPGERIEWILTPGDAWRPLH